jgi:CHRD domain
MDKSNCRYLIAAIIVVIALMLLIPSSVYAQRIQPQAKNFVAILTGKGMVPPVDTKALGTARFHMNSNGTLCYYIDVKNITGVLGSHIGLKNGTDLAQLLNPYADVGTIGSYPTGTVDGILGSGEIKARGTTEPFSSAAGGLTGPLLGKNVTDLDKMIEGNSTYVTIRTTAHENGEIQGQIVPTNQHVGCLSNMRFAYPPPTAPAASNFGP